MVASLLIADFLDTPAWLWSVFVAIVISLLVNFSLIPGGVLLSLYKTRHARTRLLLKRSE
jgi:hypothetical protein